MRRLKSAAVLLFVVCSLLISITPAAAATVHRETALRLCQEQFGAPVDAERSLFEVNRWYVLEVKFDKRDRLSELRVVRKHWFELEHPEWEEPDAPNLEGYWARYLTRYDYEKVLQRLDRIAPKGRLLQRGWIAAVTNMTAPYRDFYEHAELTRGEVLDLRRGDYVPTLFKYIKLRYRSRVELNKAMRRSRGLYRPTRRERQMMDELRKILSNDQRR